MLVWVGNNALACDVSNTMMQAVNNGCQRMPAIARWCSYPWNRWLVARRHDPAPVAVLQCLARPVWWTRTTIISDNWMQNKILWKNYTGTEGRLDMNLIPNCENIMFTNMMYWYIIDVIKKGIHEWAGNIERFKDNRCTIRVTEWTLREWTRWHERHKTRWVLWGQ